MDINTYDQLHTTKPHYKEILRLSKMLDDTDVPHKLERLYDGWKITFYGRDSVYISDVIEHFGSYGSEEDRVEMMGLVDGGDVQGYMTAQEVFEIWSKYWNNTKRGEV